MLRVHAKQRLNAFSQGKAQVVQQKQQPAEDMFEPEDDS